MSKPSPFDHAAALGESQEDLYDSGKLIIDGYDQFMINRALAHRRDAVVLVNYVNRQNLSNDMHRRFLRATLPKRAPGRGERWAKMAKHESVAEVAAFYGVSRQRALEMVDVCGHENVLAEIERMRGGKKK